MKLRIYAFPGSNHLYVFINPLNKEGSEDLPAEITWEFAQKEIAQVKGFSTSTGAGLTKGILSCKCTCYYNKGYNIVVSFFIFLIYLFLSHLLLARCDIGVQLSVRSSVRSFVRSFVRPSVRPSTICVESGNKLHFFEAVVAVRKKPCIVIVLDTLFKQAP